MPLIPPPRTITSPKFCPSSIAVFTSPYSLNRCPYDCLHKAAGLTERSTSWDMKMERGKTSFGLTLCLPLTGRMSEPASGEAEKRIHQKTPLYEKAGHCPGSETITKTVPTPRGVSNRLRFPVRNCTQRRVGSEDPPTEHARHRFGESAR